MAGARCDCKDFIGDGCKGAGEDGNESGGIVFVLSHLDDFRCEAGNVAVEEILGEVPEGVSDVPAEKPSEDRCNGAPEGVIEPVFGFGEAEWNKKRVRRNGKEGGIDKGKDDEGRS